LASTLRGTRQRCTKGHAQSTAGHQEERYKDHVHRHLDIVAFMSSLVALIGGGPIRTRRSWPKTDYEIKREAALPSSEERKQRNRERKKKKANIQTFGTCRFGFMLCVPLEWYQFRRGHFVAGIENALWT